MVFVTLFTFSKMQYIQYEIKGYNHFLFCKNFPMFIIELFGEFGEIFKKMHNFHITFRSLFHACYLHA